MNLWEALQETGVSGGHLHVALTSFASRKREHPGAQTRVHGRGLRSAARAATLGRSGAMWSGGEWERASECPDRSCVSFGP